jgi:hypothetical protein
MLENVEKVFALRILYSLEERGTQNKQTLTSGLTSSTNPIRDRLEDELVPLGLVEIKEVREGRKMEHVVSITEKGSRVAKHAIAIENILKEP